MAGSIEPYKFSFHSIKEEYRKSPLSSIAIIFSLISLGTKRAGLFCWRKRLLIPAAYKFLNYLSYSQLTDKIWT